MNRRSLLLGALGLASLGGCVLRGALAEIRPLPPLPLPPGAPLLSQGGLLLEPAAIGHGGWSALHVADDLTLSAISDQGFWLRARLVLDATGAPRGLEGVETGAIDHGFLLEPPGRLLADAESLARLPDGSWLIGFERWHRVQHHATLAAPGTLWPMPPELRQAPLNAGLESLAVLADGRLLAISEGLWTGPQGWLRGWIGGPGRWVPLGYRPAEGFVPSDACGLPGGGALVVERSFSLRRWFHARLVHLPAALLAGAGPETLLQGEVILEAQALPAENWEGVASFRHQGQDWVAMLVDDNELPVQRGLLHLFRWAGGSAP
nr:esterase-like activity of phytase family protein [Roseomonas sp. GC11]